MIEIRFSESRERVEQTKKRYEGVLNFLTYLLLLLV